MKERPILFSTLMVKSIKAGIKTQTRREEKSEHILYCLNVNKVLPSFYKNDVNGWCKYGVPGDYLYVRETHYRYGIWVEMEGEFTKTGAQKWKFIATDDEVLFYDNAPASFKKRRPKDNPEIPHWYIRPSIHMPKSATRIWLKILSTKIERLWSITEADAIREGIEAYFDFYQRVQYTDYIKTDSDGNHLAAINSVHSFLTFWEKINGAESLKANPWVRVIEFEKAQKPE